MDFATVIQSWFAGIESCNRDADSTLVDRIRFETWKPEVTERAATDCSNPGATWISSSPDAISPAIRLRDSSCWINRVRDRRSWKRLSLNMGRSFSKIDGTKGEFWFGVFGGVT